MNDLLHMELRSDSLKMVDQALEETLMAMEIVLEMVLLEGRYYRRNRTSGPSSDQVHRKESNGQTHVTGIGHRHS